MPARRHLNKVGTRHLTEYCMCVKQLCRDSQGSLGFEQVFLGHAMDKSVKAANPRKGIARSKLVPHHLTENFDDMTKLIRVSFDKQYRCAKKCSEHVREGSETNENKLKQKSWQKFWVYSESQSISLFSTTCSRQISILPTLETWGNKEFRGRGLQKAKWSMCPGHFACNMTESFVCPSMPLHEKALVLFLMQAEKKLETS